MKEKTEENVREEMEQENDKYEDILLLTKVKIGMMTQEEADEIMKRKGKKK